MLRAGIDDRATELSPELEAEFRDVLAPDVRRLRDEYLGSGFDGWGII